MLCLELDDDGQGKTLKYYVAFEKIETFEEVEQMQDLIQKSYERS